MSRRSWSGGPTAANYVAVDVPPPDQVWLPWMIRFAASGPRLANRLKVDKTAAGIPTERSDCLVKAPCMHVCCNGECEGESGSGERVIMIWATIRLSSNSVRCCHRGCHTSVATMDLISCNQLLNEI